MARDIEPIGAPRINTIPLGLLSLLGIQNGGRYPEWMPNVLQPTFDMTRWYLDQDIVTQSPAANAVNAVGNFDVTANSLRVPPNELWWVVGYHVSTNGALGAGQSARFRSAWQPAGGAGNNVIVGEVTSCAANEVARATSLGGFWAGPGSAFVGVMETFAAGPISMRGTVGYKALRV